MARFFSLQVRKTVLPLLLLLLLAQHAAPQATHHAPETKASSQAPQATCAAPQTNTTTWFLSRVPADAWDSHMHIIDAIRFPLSASATYTIGVHSLWSGLAFETSIAMTGLVIVQPSVYGTDNTLLLQVLGALGPSSARGVVQVPVNVSRAELRAWHRVGVRGVRLNLQSTTETLDAAALALRVKAYAEIVRPLRWVLQIYTGMERLREIEDTLLGLNVTLCFDHFAGPALPALAPGEQDQFDVYSVPGFASLVRLLQQGRTYVKFSAAYRVDGQGVALESVAREMLRLRSDRMVFGTDWPHTRFEEYNVGPFVQRCLEWAEEFDCVEELFSSNARRLWDVQE
ncbi:hypothetical protein ACJBU6_07695 [Exserohilum turcicum]